MKLILFISCLLILQACVKHPVDCCLPPQQEMVRTQTQCADAWGYGESNEETITKLTNFLLQKNIVVAKITLQSTGEEVTCLACTCSRGYIIHVWVEQQYTERLSKEGFTRK